MNRSLPPRLAALHATARAQPMLWRFTLANRILLAWAFIPTGLVKATGQRFTLLGIDNPVGFFFEAMYQTGPYWRFIGLSQITAAVLLLIPRTATLGALLFAPIITSICLITWGIGFQGTVWVTSGMLLSVTYLLCWDADRIWAAGSHLWERVPAGHGLLAGAHWLEKTGWVLGGLVGMSFFLFTRGFVPSSLVLELMVTGAVAVVLVVAGWIAGMVGRRRTSGQGA